MFLSSCFSPFSFAITSLWEEGANLCAFRTFVRCALVWFCLFPLPVVVWEELRTVILAFHRLLAYFRFIKLSIALRIGLSHFNG